MHPIGISSDDHVISAVKIFARYLSKYRLLAGDKDQGKNEKSSPSLDATNYLFSEEVVFFHILLSLKPDVQVRPRQFLLLNLKTTLRSVQLGPYKSISRKQSISGNRERMVDFLFLSPLGNHMRQYLLLLFPDG